MRFLGGAGSALVLVCILVLASLSPKAAAAVLCVLMAMVLAVAVLALACNPLPRDDRGTLSDWEEHHMSAQTDDSIRLPPSSGVQGDSRTRVLLAVVAGANTWSSVMASTNLSRASVNWHLRHLRSDGLVAWEPSKRATLRPLVEMRPLCHD